MTKDFCNSLCNSHVAVYNNSVNTEIKSVQPGDLVKSIDFEENGTPERGMIIGTGYNMWGEEMIPTGVKVLWSDGDSFIVSSDELEVISEAG